MKTVKYEDHKINYSIHITDMELVRKGKCQPDKCKSACCKFFMMTKCERNEKMDKYYSSFFDKTNIFGDYIMEKPCKNLDIKNNKCKVWGTKDFPEVCKQFPNPTDSVYKHVFEVCTFKFEMEPVHPEKQTIREETIKHEEDKKFDDMDMRKIK